MDNVEQMNHLISDARELMGQMKAQYEINKEQIELMNDRLEQNTERMLSAFRVFRNIAITLITFIIVPAFIGGANMDKRLTRVEYEQQSEDHAERSEMINGFSIIIENHGDMFEDVGMPPEEVTRYNNRIEEGITRSIETSRSPEKDN